MNVEGLHYHLPVLFDYFHLSTVTLSVHGSLTTLCLPYLSMEGLCTDSQGHTEDQSQPFSPDHERSPFEFSDIQKTDTLTNSTSKDINLLPAKLPLTSSSPPQLTPLIGYDYLLFGCSFAQLDQHLCNPKGEQLLRLRERRAQLLHWQLCSLLCISLQSLRRKLHETVKLLPPWQQAKNRKRVFGRLKLRSLSALAQACYRSCLENGPRAGNRDLLAYQNAYFAKQVRPLCEQVNACSAELEERNKNMSIMSEVNGNGKTNNNCPVNRNDSNNDGSLRNSEIFNDNDFFVPTQLADNNETNGRNLGWTDCDIQQPEDYAARVGADMAYLCGCLIVLWQLLVRLVSHNDRIASHLAKVHHLHRCKRFSEAFFVKERSRQQLMMVVDNSTAAQQMCMADQLRKSEYLKRLPRCSVECAAVDGDQSTMPIIFEERFHSQDDESSSSSDAQSKTDIESTASSNGPKRSEDADSSEHATNRQIRRSMSDLSTSSSTGSASTSSGCCSVGSVNKRNLPFKLWRNIGRLGNGKLLEILPGKQKNSNKQLSSSPSSSSSLCNSASSSLPTPAQDPPSQPSTFQLNHSPAKSLDMSRNERKSQPSKSIDEKTIDQLQSESPQRLLGRLTSCSDRLIGFRHYNNVRGELDEAKLLAANGCEQSLYCMVETVSLQNIQSVDANNVWLNNSSSSNNHNRTNGKQQTQQENQPSNQQLGGSESLPDMSMRGLQKSIQQITGKRSPLSRMRLRNGVLPSLRKKPKSLGKKWRENGIDARKESNRRYQNKENFSSQRKKDHQTSKKPKKKLENGEKQGEKMNLSLWPTSVDKSANINVCTKEVNAVSIEENRLNGNNDLWCLALFGAQSSSESDFDEFPVFEESGEEEDDAEPETEETELDSECNHTKIKSGPTNQMTADSFFEDQRAKSAPADPNSDLGRSDAKSSSRSERRRRLANLENEKCTILDMFKLDTCLLCGQQSCDCSQDFELTTGLKRMSMITNDLVSFVRAKERFRQQMELNSKGKLNNNCFVR